MFDTNVYKIRYYVDGLLHKSVVLAECYEDAKAILIGNYKEYDIEIEIDEWEYFEEGDEGVILTWHEPIK